MVGIIMDTADANTKIVGGGGKSATQWPSFRVTPPDPVLGRKEMSPEQTLVEFISTSAAYHGVKRQQMRTLEWDLLKVFPNNIMPANAAAWFMAKRKFYMNQPLDQQLLPFLLKKYPDKFQIKRNQVFFLEKYSKETAKRKLQYLVQYGINAYFAHKADEYGVYFFDPYYYENTEPFHESLRQTTNKPNAHRSKLVPEYFNIYKDQFKFEQHSPYLVSISKQPGVRVVTNTTGVIVSMVNNQYGFIKFGSSEKALFCAKSLFRDGWQFTGDPLRLPAMQFDGYQIPGGGSHGEQQYTWYAVLVWCGRKPSPKFCSTTDDLNSTPVFRVPGGDNSEDGGMQGKKLRQPSSSMMIGQVIEIRKNGAIVSVRDDSEEKVYVPGWRHESQSKRGVWLTTLTGENLGLRDLVAYYVDTNNTKQGYHAVGKNVMVLKEYEEVEVNSRKKNRRASSAYSSRMRGVSEESDDYEPRQRTRYDDSDDDSYDDTELEVDDSELEWLERDIESIIETEPPEAKTLKLLVEVKSALVGARELSGRKTTPTPTRGKTTPSPGPDSGVASKETTPRIDMSGGYQPLPDQEQSFGRLKAALANLDDYHSEDDDDYRPGQDIDQEETTQDSSGLSDSSGFLVHSGIMRRNRMSSMASSGTSDLEGGKYVPYWAKAVQQPMVWCAHTNKFLVLDLGYKEERDWDYCPPFTEDEESEEEDEEDLETLKKEAEEPLDRDLLDGKHRIAGAVTKPPQIVITPPKKEKGDEVSEPEDRAKEPVGGLKERVEGSGEAIDAEQEIVTLEDTSGEDKSEGDGGEGDKSGENDAAAVGEAKLWIREMTKDLEEGYDSDKDPEWVPPSIIEDIDLDYDEVNEEDCAISDGEVEHLQEDMKKTLEPGPDLPLLMCGCVEDKEMEAEHPDKRTAVNLSPESGLTPAMKKLRLSGQTTKDQEDVKKVEEKVSKLKLSDLENNEKEDGKKAEDEDGTKPKPEAPAGEKVDDGEGSKTKPEAPKPKRTTPKKTKVKVGEKEKVKSPTEKVEKSPKRVPEKVTKSPEKTKTPAKDKVDVKEAKAPVKDKVDVKEAKAPVKDKADVKEVKAPVKEKADVKEAKAPVKDKADVKEAKAPVKDKADVKEVKAPVKDKADVKEAKEKAKTPVKDKLEKAKTDKSEKTGEKGGSPDKGSKVKNGKSPKKGESAEKRKKSEDGAKEK